MSRQHAVPRDPRFSTSIQHGLAMMQCFTSEERLRGIADLSELLSLNRSTTHRYAVTLVALGFLEQTASRKYFLAPKAASFGAAVLADIAARSGCEPVLQELRARTRHTVGLAVLDGTRATFVRRLYAHLQGQYEADMDLRAGAHLPLHCTALGKALLASVPEEEYREILSGIELNSLGPNTIKNRKALAQEIAGIRQGGAAVADEEFAPGVRSLAVPVEDPAGRWRLAVGVNVPAAALTVSQLHSQLAEHVGDAAQRISASLSA